jgi:hypothetical protein
MTAEEFATQADEAELALEVQIEVLEQIAQAMCEALT